MDAIVCTQLNGMRSIRQMLRTNEISLAIARKRWNVQRKRTPQKAKAKANERRTTKKQWTKITIGLVRIYPELLLQFECTTAIVILLPLRCHCFCCPHTAAPHSTVCTWCSLNVKNGRIFVICKMKLFDFCFYFRNRVCTLLHTFHELMGVHWLTGWLTQMACIECASAFTLQEWMGEWPS